MGAFHQIAWVGLHPDLEDDIADTYLSSRDLGCRDTLDQKVGPARRPRERYAQLTAGVIPAFAKQNSYLAVALAPAYVAVNSAFDAHRRGLHFLKRHPQLRSLGNADQFSTHWISMTSGSGVEENNFSTSALRRSIVAR